MNAQKNLTIRFIADTAMAEKNVDKLQAKINKMGGKQPGQSGPSVAGGKGSLFDTLKGGSLGNATEGLSSQMGGLAGSLANLGPSAAIAAAGIAAVGFTLSKTMHAGMEAEDAITKMTVLFGGDKIKALKTFKDAVDFSNVTPFDPADVVPAAVAAGQYGMDAFQKGLGSKKDKHLMDVIGDMASFSGQSMEEASTALFRGDLQLLDKYGKAGRDAYSKALEGTQLGTDQFRKAFIKNMSEVQLWDGMAEKRSKTISGMWSTIVGNFNTAFMYLSGAGEGDQVLTFWGQLKSIVGDITDGSGSMLEEIRPLLIEFGAMIGAQLKGLWDSAKAIFTVLKPMLAGAWMIMKFGFEATMFIVTKFWQVVSGLARGIAFVSSTVQGWITGSKTIMDGVKGFMTWMDNVSLKVQMILVFLGLWWDGFWASARKWFQNFPKMLHEAFTKGWALVKENPLTKALGNGIEATGDMIQQGYEAVGIKPATAEDAKGLYGDVNTSPYANTGTVVNNTNNRGSTTVNVNVATPSQAQNILNRMNQTGRPMSEQGQPR